jgi:hypothetical protein
MAETDRLTREEWQDLEPVLSDADKAVHERFLSDPQATALLGGSDSTPGYVLLRHLRDSGDEEGVKLLRAVETYQHEITRADITVAFLRGKEVGRSESKQ